MEIKIINTDDGSSSLYLPSMNETYHSKFGAQTESMHVFINAGYKQLHKNNIHILEIGFGTGLNVFLTYKQHIYDKKTIYFETIEKFPLHKSIYTKLNFTQSTAEKSIFYKIHESEWQKDIYIDDNFVLCKKEVDLINYNSDKHFDIIYFDAFDPAKQPELWTEDVFDKMYKLLNNNGILVTYSAKGIVRRAMQNVGFKVERIPGPPGKREMMRAIKII